jgi:type IV secretory pathway VirB10-like protein
MKAAETTWAALMCLVLAGCGTPDVRRPAAKPEAPKPVEAARPPEPVPAPVAPQPAPPQPEVAAPEPAPPPPPVAAPAITVEPSGHEQDEMGGKTIGQWVRLLHSANKTDLLEAIEYCRLAGYKARLGIPRLTVLCESPDKEIANAAREALQAVKAQEP